MRFYKKVGKIIRIILIIFVLKPNAKRFHLKKKILRRPDLNSANANTYLTGVAFESFSPAFLLAIEGRSTGG